MDDFSTNHIETAINIFNQTSDFYVYKDKELRYRLINKYAANALGFKSTSVSFDGITDYDLPCKSSELADTYRKDDKFVLRTGKTITIVGLAQYADDDWKLLLGRKSPLKNQDDQTIGIYTRFMDVSDCGLLRSTFMLLNNQDKIYRLDKSSLSQASYILKDKYDKFGLTPVESEVLFYMVRGKTAKEIAQCIGRGHRTVEKHIERLKLKTDCHTKSQIIEKALHAGLGSIIPKNVLSRNAPTNNEGEGQDE